MANECVIVESPIAAAMGARISLAGPKNGTYLVIGRGAQLDSLLRIAGGKIILRFNGRKMLAALPFAGYLQLRDNYQISHIGPVTVDTKRLARVAEMLANAKKPVPGTGG